MAAKDHGFSLVEVCVAAALSALLVVALLPVWTDVWQFSAMILGDSEADAVRLSIHRVLQQDAHAAVSASAANGVLHLTLVDGTVYTYQVNASRQLVRVRTGGGTAVIGVDVRAFEPTCQGNTVTVRVSVANAGQDTYVFTLLPKR
ncbi:MAG: hypothetical protein IRZ10_06175 [Thermoflavifilum sp.]|nr:hypothetical protein [Thermoflavifilum sp.]MCL6513991.1 hypothetical protein [Alicyclobacillus sp.]